MFTGSSASGHEDKSKESRYVYGIGYWSAFSGSAVSTPYEAAGRIVEAINFASQSGDLAMSATQDGATVNLKQLYSGKSGNTQLEGPFITAGALVGVSHFTGGTGTPGTGSIPSNVVGDYTSRSVASHASDFTPFDDSRARTNIALQDAYLSNFAPGFTKNLGDRVMIEIDITPSKEHVLRVLSGADGQCYIVGNPGILPGDHTGLAYFNFEDKQWENTGAVMPRYKQSGYLIPWNLPEEVSSSADPVRNGGSIYEGNAVGRMIVPPNNSARTLDAMRNVNIHSAPRLFQPFSSLTAHRSTFNFIYDWDYMNRTGPGTGNKFTQEVPGYAGVFPAIDNSSIWKSTYPATEDPKRTKLGTPEYPTDRFYAVHSRFQCDMVNVMTSDWLGLSKRLDPNVAGSTYDFRKPKFWNVDSPGTTGSVFYNAINDQLGAVGLPIAYTKFSTHPRFYASASQLLRVGDYIDTPFLLEAMEIETDVDVRRMFYTTVVTQSGGRGTFDQKDVSAWSTTNNAVDCLTFFLCKQDDPNVAGPGLGDSINQNAKASRELITWSNNVFYSPFIGWDFWQSWSHPYVSEQQPVPAASHIGAGPDGKWPRPVVADEVHFAYYPACGRRIARYFRLDNELIESNVEACDTVTGYKTFSGNAPILNAGGLSGIFPQAKFLTEPLTGIPTGSSPGDSDRNRAKAPAQERWMSASLHINNLFPVRVCSEYYQHDTPLLPADQFCKGGSGGGVAADRNNIIPFAQTTVAGSLLAPGGGALTVPWVGQAGWDWLGRFMTYGDKMMTGPREYLSCYGRWWPGGTKTSLELGEAQTTGWALPNATLQRTSSADPSCNKVTIPTDQDVPASSPRLFSKKNNTKIQNSSLLGRSSRVSAEFAPSFDNNGDRMPMIHSTRPPDELLYSRPLGQGTTGFEPYFAKFPTSGNLAYNSAYILDPADNLVFGCQWSPADPVHRSFRNVERVLKYGGNGADYGVDCAYQGVGLTPETGWGITGKQQTGPTSPSTQILSQFMPTQGWMPPAGTPQDGGGNPTTPDSHRKPMEYQYRFLGWDQSNDLTVHASASCTIKATPQKIRLYGVLLKNQKQYHHLLSQQTKTACVHEAISNGPVIDQYDLATNSDFIGSLSAMIFSGSIRNKNPVGGPGLLTKNYAMTTDGYGVPTGSCARQVWGTSDGTNAGMHAPDTFSRLYDMGSIKRTLTLHDVSEIYYDSMTPSIKGLWRKDGFQLLNYDPAGFPTQVPFAAWAYTHVGDGAFEHGYRMGHTYWTINSGSTWQTNTSPNYKWPLAFPFEPRYEGVRRVLAEIPLKVAGVVDRNHTDGVVGQHVATVGGGVGGKPMSPYRNALFTSGGMYQGFSWETGWAGTPIMSLGEETALSTNELAPAEMYHSPGGFGTQWCAKRGGLQDIFTSGSAGRATGNRPTSAWESNSPVVTVYKWESRSPTFALDTFPAQETWCGPALITDPIVNGAFGGTHEPFETEVPRYSAVCTIGEHGLNNYRNLGYVFYPHYPRVLKLENLRAPLTTQRMTGPEFNPPIQYSYHSGGFGQVCVKNTIFGVGRLMFAPEPTHVFLSSSQDIIANSPVQFERFHNRGMAAPPTAGYSFFDAYGASPHFDFFCGKPRGWRYGLLNGFPLRPTCVFRRDRFGQFRDMLEQRQYTAFYVDDPADVAISRRERGRFVRKRLYPRGRGYAVKATFRTPVWENPNASNTRVSPADTQCSNLNLYATSSLPYFDGMVKNRDALPSTTDVVII